MLVLSRKPDESLVIDGGIRVTVLGVRGGQIRLGIEAPKDVRVFREELLAADPALRVADRRVAGIGTKASPTRSLPPARRTLP